MSGPPTAPALFGKPQESTPRSMPGSGIFGAAKGIASTALHVAQLALGEEDRSNTGFGKLLHGEIDDAFNPLESLREMLDNNVLTKDALAACNVAVAQPGAMDDRKMLLERVIVLLYSLPPDSKIGDVLENAFIRLLWNDLQHPPVTFVGKSKYRSADGSGNNFFNPRLGAAGEPYARSVVPAHPMPQQLPDNGTVWDTLMKRDEFVPHPSGISSLLFAFATCITHSCFNTNLNDRNINDASSYLDLSPLYGNNQEEQNKVRTMKDGKLHDDVVASQRLFLMAPPTCALMMVFSRNHNWIVDKLMEINQNDKFKPFDQLSDSQKKQQDEDLFQTARLVNCGWFLNVIFGDYIRVILNVNQTASTWALIPTDEIKPLVGDEVERGKGNTVSIEFDLLYRWHACVSQKDTKWVEDLIRKYTKTPFDQMTPEDYGRIYRGLAGEMGSDVKKWTFGGLKRSGKDGAGRFSDDDLVRVLTEGTEEVAGAFKARGVPEAMRVFDVISMDAARNQWACATLNEFRSFLKLTTYKSFEEWNPDPVIANAARSLYKHIDNLELMPGLSAEEPKPSQTGSGLATGYTVSRAILSDAAALVRGDRYFTVDFNPGNLTSFLYKDLQFDTKGGAFGGVVGKLLMRTFPAHYTYNSTYALFPFSTPSTTNGILSNLGLLDQYDTRRPGPPPEWVVIDRRAAAEQILAPESPSFDQFAPVYGAPLDVLKQQEPSFLSLLSSFKTKLKARSECQDVIDSAFFPSQFTNLVVAAIAPKARAVLAETSWSAGASQMRVDVVERVIVPVCMSWISDQLGFPLKTKTNPLGLLTPVELYDTLCEAYTYLHLNYDPTRGFKLRNSVIEHTRVLKNVIDFRLSQANGSSSLLHDFAQDIKELLLGKKAGQGVVMSDNARKVYDRVLRVTSRPLDEISDTLLYSMINFVSSVTACAKTVDFYLRSENAGALRNLQSQTAVEVGLANDSTIQHYVNECLRLDPAVEGFVRQAQSDVQIPNGPRVKEGTLLYIDWTRVNRDPSAFPDPDTIKLDRNPVLYKLAEPGIRSSRDESINTLMAVGLAKEVFRLSNLRRAPQAAGKLGGVKGAMGGPASTATTYILKDQQMSPFPQSMEVLYTKNA
ncbi:peroxidase/cytochrome P450 family protein [Sporobolomyces koalae]|uniref:peroxidase/cytochrome P450 family protein n=1 Tax=Sporobolomyces koalae TaxID=500713 RepID=UPI003180AB92